MAAVAGWVLPALSAGAGILQGIGQMGAASAASGAQVGQLQQQYAEMMKLLSPFSAAGTQAIQGQQAIAGLGGAEAQRGAISGIEASPEFQSMVQQGEEALLSGASATGGLRGGNVQGALAQFRPGILSELINKQYSRLGGLSQMGLQAAQGQAQAGGNIFPAIGRAQAGGILGQAKGFGQMVNAPFQALGTSYGLTGKLPF